MSKQTLLIVTNIFVFCEEVSILQDLDDTYFTINPNYVKSEKIEKILRRNIHQLFPELNFIEWQNICEISWNQVVCSSYLVNGTYETLIKLNTNCVQLVEDGSYDYFTEDVKYKEFLKDKQLWFFRPENAIVSYLYKSVNKLTISEWLMNKIKN